MSMKKSLLATIAELEGQVAQHPFHAEADLDVDKEVAGDAELELRVAQHPIPIHILLAQPSLHLQKIQQDQGFSSSERRYGKFSSVNRTSSTMKRQMQSL
jgi:hypothetical protein